MPNNKFLAIQNTLIPILILFLLALPVVSSELETKNYILKVNVKCEEGSVTCDNVIFNIQNKKTSLVTKIKGSTWYSWNNKVPIHFLGYKFKEGKFTYFASEDGIFSKIEGRSKVIFEEVGKWKY